MVPRKELISSVLFNIMINDIFRNNGRGFGQSLFADDGAIWRRGRNAEVSLKQFQRALVSVEEWADKWGFKISSAKSKFMIFGFRRKLANLGLHMYGSSLKRVKDFKFLGVMFDERITWAVHIAKILTKCD